MLEISVSEVRKPRADWIPFRPVNWVQNLNEKLDQFRDTRANDSRNLRANDCPSASNMNVLYLERKLDSVFKFFTI